MVNKVLFNAWLTSEHIIQGAEVSMDYNEEKGGYKLTIVGKDGGELLLYVVLNWIYPLSEVDTSDPQPILTSAHIEHSVSECDLERSEVFGSKFIINVQADPIFIIPDRPRKCTSVMEPGRWLNVIPKESDCRVPYCTGDRFSTFISSMSW